MWNAFGSYQESPEQAFRNAVTLMAAGAQMVKLEGGRDMAKTVKFLVDRGIPVCGHLGLTPQSVHVMGGYKVQGKGDAAAQRLKDDALALQEAGATMIVLEAIPQALAAATTGQLTIPTIGIGASRECTAKSSSCTTCSTSRRAERPASSGTSWLASHRSRRGSRPTLPPSRKARFRVLNTVTEPGEECRSTIRNPHSRAPVGLSFQFERGLAAEPERIVANWEHQWHYTRLGFYHTKLVRYFALFPPNQIAVYTYDEPKANPAALMQQLFRFLAVDESFVPDFSIKHNVSGTPKSQAINRFLIRPNWVKDWLRPLLPRSLRRTLGLKVKQINLNTDKTEMPPQARTVITRLYRDEIVALQTLIGQDLSHWLKS